MRHLFVESNWVFAVCAPEHLREPAALQLLRQAEQGVLKLYLPAICLREGGDAIRKKCQPRVPEEMSGFLRSARRRAMLSLEHSERVTQALELYRATVTRELRTLEDTLDAIRRTPGVEAFALSDAMLERAIQLRSEGASGLEPFDESILAAVLVRAQALRETHGRESGFELAFCTLDGHLQPWTRHREAREPFATLYGQAGLRVYGDFAHVAGVS